MVIKSRDVHLDSLLQEISEIDRELSIFLDDPIEPFRPKVARLLKEGLFPLKNTSLPKHPQKQKDKNLPEAPAVRKSRNERNSHLRDPYSGGIQDT